MEILATTATELFEKAVDKLLTEGEEVTSRGSKTRRLTGVTFILDDPLQNIVQTKWRKISMEYIDAELKWYDSMDPDVTEIGKIAKLWTRICDKDNKANSNYGYLIGKKYGFDQFQYCADLLLEDKYTRQAIMHLKWPDTDFGLDTPCTISLQFLITKDTLELHTFMRSNDIWWGFCNDIAYFTELQKRMLHLLNESMQSHLEIGRYVHHVGDLHMYEKDWHKAPSKA